MQPLKFKAWCIKEKEMHDISSIDFSKGKVWIWDTDILGDLTTIDLSFEEVKILQAIGEKDSSGKDIYIGDVLKYSDGIGYVVYEGTEYIIKVIAGSDFYGYDGAREPWTATKIAGNIYEDDLINLYKYGITRSGRAVTRESAKKKFVNAVKKGWHTRGTFVPTQALIPDRIGIQLQEVVRELRDELVREGKIVQDPSRPWMCKRD